MDDLTTSKPAPSSPATGSPPDVPTPQDRARSQSLLKHLIETRRPQVPVAPLSPVPLTAGVRA